MLDSGGPEQLEEWAAYHAMRPWGDDWHRTSLMTSAILNQIIASTPSEGEREFYDQDDFVPKVVDKQKDLQEIKAKCEAADSLSGLGV